jgi:hypothetical protein
MAKAHSTTIPTEGKAIIYDRETKDFACYLEGQFIGYARTYFDAETKINKLAYEQLAHEQATSADIAADVAADVAATVLTLEQQLDVMRRAAVILREGAMDFEMAIRIAWDLVAASVPAAHCPTCGSDGSPCVDCNPLVLPVSTSGPVCRGCGNYSSELKHGLCPACRITALTPGGNHGAL